jgi:hypothetical protein
MVVPIVGFPAGQTAELDDIVVTLTYFNRNLESRKPDGKVTFMFTNLGDEAQTVSISLAIATNGSDYFKGRFKLTETVEPKSVIWRSFQHDEIKSATFAKFMVTSGFDQTTVPPRFAAAETVEGEPAQFIEV